MNSKSLRCRFAIHRWVVRREPGIAPYHECARCGKAKVVDLNLRPGALG